MQRQFFVHEVHIGSVTLGGTNPVALQSMTNTPTLSVGETVEQCVRIIDAGADMVRISARNKAELKAVSEIKKILNTRGYKTPVIADIHFSASLAADAVYVVEKVRINPGNFYKGKSDISEKEHYETIRENLKPLIHACSETNTAIRIGTNHGSLSERIKYLYGTGPLAMAEASMEFVRIIAETGFKNVILSVKASDVLENIRATTLLAQMQHKEGYSYPLHLGVTEAGLGFSGRVKSALGIGALLADGIGDTIRVSLTEAPEHELPVTQSIAGLFSPKKQHFDELKAFNVLNETGLKPQIPEIFKANINQNFLIFGNKSNLYLPGLVPDIHTEELNMDNCVFINTDHFALPEHIDPQTIFCVETAGPESLYDFRRMYTQLCQSVNSPYVIWKPFLEDDEIQTLRFAAEMGSLINSNVIRGCWPVASGEMLKESMAVLYEVLQVCRIRNTHAEFVSCPSCNRTSFDIIQLAEEVRSRTYHLKGLTIAVMGCIVNGPGEMGAADFGLVGQGKGLLALYHRGEMIMKDIPEHLACEKLLEAIKNIDS